MKTCYFCRGPVESGRIDYMAKHPAGYTLVRELPVEVCTQCGEAYLDGESSGRIDRALRDARTAEEHLRRPRRALWTIAYLRVQLLLAGASPHPQEISCPFEWGPVNLLAPRAFQAQAKRRLSLPPRRARLHPLLSKCHEEEPGLTAFDFLHYYP